jgi:hypothetical protein
MAETGQERQTNIAVTHKSPTLRLISDPHTYTEQGGYRILVKVIDIFGNDTTQLAEVMV